MPTDMKVLLVGSGGREDALAWALRQSPSVRLLRCCPGNAGIAQRAEPVGIPAHDTSAITAHAALESYDLVVIGPEVPLCAGLADRLEEAGVAAFGPTAAAARLEGSKIFAKEFMARHGIPTAPFCSFDDVGEATRYLLSEEASYPLVIKADGLAAGKGVFLAEEPESGVEVAERMMSGGAFGPAGTRILVEDRLWGREASFFVLSDGEQVVELASCQDYKRVHDGDRGPNTGGMGACSPSAWLDPSARQMLRDEIALRTIRALASEGHPYRGVLYVGVMLTERGPMVLEYNVRFGDPEAQVLVPRLDGEWLPLLWGAARGGLQDVAPRWKTEAAVCVVMSSEGYPDAYPTGLPIGGLEEAGELGGVLVFHSGTARDAAGRVVTAGGRVLAVTALGADLARAREQAYAAVARIRWRGEHHRADIALDAVAAVADGEA